MEANVLPHTLSSSKPATLLLISNHSSPFTSKLPLPPAHFRLPSLKTTRKTTTTTNSSSGDGGGTPPTDTSPQDTVGIRFKRGSRRRAKKKELDNSDGGREKPSPPKDWESMTIPEKAVELYMGEKGLLFWLNKFAYASIYITIGAWILFRFVGPALGLYQLDTPPLSPTSILK